MTSKDGLHKRLSVSIVLGLPSRIELAPDRRPARMHRESAQREHGEILEIGRAGSSRRPLRTEIQIEWRSEWQPENNHLKPPGIVAVLKLCHYSSTGQK